jgi:xanthine dehydrogenase YagS FAD-binding subunit
MPAALLEAVQRTSRLSDKATLGGNLLQRPQCTYFRDPALACFKKGGATCPAGSAPADSYPGALYPGVCHAAHPSDLAPALIALDAQAEILAWDGARRVPLRALFGDAAFNREREVQLAQDELLTAVIVPDGPPTQAFASVPVGAGAAVAVAAALEIDQGLIDDVRIVASGVAPGPFVFGRGRDLLVGRRPPDIDAGRIASELVQVEVRLPIALRASAARRAIERALSIALLRR